MGDVCVPRDGLGFFDNETTMESAFEETLTGLGKQFVRAE